MLSPGLPVTAELHAGHLQGWLHRITTTSSLTWPGAGSESASRALARTPKPASSRGDEPTPAQAFDARHLDGDVQQALAALAPVPRAAVVLCDIEGLSYEEVASTLGVKLGTVRSRIHRGRAQLRVALEHRRPRQATRVSAEATTPSTATGGPA